MTELICAVGTALVAVFLLGVFVAAVCMAILKIME